MTRIRVDKPTGISNIVLVLLIAFSFLFLETRIEAQSPPSPGPSRAIQGSSGTAPPYPPSTRWRMIDSPQHRIIFPAGFENQALRVAQLGEGLEEDIAQDYGVEVPQLPLILNTSRQVSNGYVTLAPRHSLWYGYNVQQQFAGPLDWYSLLALHEGRHVVQFEALNQGFTRFAGWAAGEYGRSFFSMYSMPLWYFEGDAILSETALSSAGRGRSAAFHREIRAILGEDRLPSYSQAYLGSYSEHFPNHYHLGFPLVTYIRHAYGPEAWKEIVRETAKFSFWPLRFHRAVKKVTGCSMPELYQDGMAFLSDYFTERDRFRTTTKAERVFPREEREEWINYLPLSVDVENRLYVLRYGDREAPALVRVKVGEKPSDREGETARPSEELVCYLPDRHQRPSVSAGRAVWTEELPHPLWSKVSTSAIVLFEIDEGRRHLLTGDGAYQAPSLSPEGDRVAVIEALPGGGGRLILLDADGGTELLATAPPPVDVDSREGEPLFLRQPAWSPEGDRLAVIALQHGQNRLWEYSIEEDSWRPLSEPAAFRIADPRYFHTDDPEKEYLAYVSERSGTEAIEALPTSGRAGKDIYLIASRPFGAIGPVAAAGRIYFADYTADGFHTASITPPMERLLSPDETDAEPIDYVNPIAKEWSVPQRGGDESSSAETTEEPSPDRRGEYPIEEYGPLSGILNYHSWGAIPDFEGGLEFFARSDEILSRLSLTNFGGFNLQNDRYYLGLQGTYRGFFPILQFGLSADTNSPTDPDSQWYGATALLGADAPLNLSRGVWFRRLSLNTTAYLRYEEARPEYDGDQDAYALPIGHSLSWYGASKASSPADFAPPWEQYLELNALYTAAPAEYWGRRFGLQGLLTFPGPARSHRLQLSLSGEAKSGREVPLNTPSIRPRAYPFGWNEHYPENAVASLQYSLPLLYPDMEIGSVYFLKRVRGTAFADLGVGLPAEAATVADPTDGEPPWWLRRLESKTGAALHPTVGVELLFEQHLFSWPLALETGLRFAYSLRNDRFRVEETLLLLGVQW